MSLGKLLTAGRSLVAGESSGRYRMRKQVRLPKFVSPRNPFTPESAVAKTEPQPAMPAETNPVQTRAGVVIPSAGEIEPMGKPDRLAGLGEVLRGLGENLSRVNPFSKRGSHRGPARSAIPHFNKPAVQTELSLEKICVVRNDLSDTDLEIVPAAGPVTAEPPPQAADVANNHSAAPQTWGRLANRLFGAETT